MADADIPEIRARPCPNCHLCDNPGERLYKDLRDRLFGAPGAWTLKRCANLDCGLLWLDPMPLEEDIGKAYTEYFTHEAEEPDDEERRHSLKRRWRRYIEAGYLANHYGYRPNQISAWQLVLGLLLYAQPLRRERVDFETVRCLAAKPGGRLLDVGCGKGAWLASMAERGWQVEGVDFDPKAAAAAKRQGVPVRLGDIRELHYPQAHFDAVTLNHVIEHVHDPVRLLRECRRILKPDGVLVAITPNAASWGHACFGAHWRGLEPPRHLHIFRPSSLHKAARAAGFDAPHVRGTTKGAAYILRASRELRGTGRHDDHDPSPRSTRRWARRMRRIEWLLSRFQPTLGEELVLIVTQGSDERERACS